MKRTALWATFIVASLILIAVGSSISAQNKQDKYTLKVPGGLALSDFRGYEDWLPVAPSTTESQHVIRLIVANPVMIKAYREGVPGNGKPFPDGSKIAKILWTPKTVTDPPFSASIPDTIVGPLTRLEFIEKDSKRFPDTHGWGYADFDYNAATDTFKPGTLADNPPQANDAKCGATCHNLAATKDFIFTDYPKR